MLKAEDVQVLRMGEPITAVSLAPAMDLLATTHVGRRGIYLWSNQLLFGTGVPPAHSDRPVDARLPAITPGMSIYAPLRTHARSCTRMHARMHAREPNGVASHHSRHATSCKHSQDQQDT